MKLDNFICSVFSNQALNLMKKINLKIWKIASGELFDDNMITKIAKQKGIIIVSNGMSDLKETKIQIRKIKKYNKKLILLHCNSIYPTQLEDINFKKMQILHHDIPADSLFLMLRTKVLELFMF